MELEQQNKELLTAVAQSQLGPERKNGDIPTDEEKKAAPWWKMW